MNRINKKIEACESASACEAPALTPGGPDAHIEDLGDGLFFFAFSAAMKEIRAQVDIIAKVDLPVLILGESGVGKEVLARLIHQTSSRRKKMFLKVNCAALPYELLESELFGYDAGAFTGAYKPKPGKFELCNCGTILLDEIGEMASGLQAKLLQVLQDGHFSRLGGRSTIEVDVRVIAVTNINVRQAIAERTFREDLYYRLNTFTLNVPPLRERREEIPMLLTHFMARHAKQFGKPPLAYPEKLMNACIEYHWPGNLRELGNTVKRYLILNDAEGASQELQLKIQNFKAASREIAPSPPALPGGSLGDLKELVCNLKRNLRNDALGHTIEEALIASNWNRRRAASALQISYKALLNKIRRYNLEPPGRNKRSVENINRRSTTGIAGE